jgi:FkbM family methyltransferase
MDEIMKVEEFDYKVILDMDFLTNSSIVFDIAANTGVWAEQLYNKYKPQMYCFEPQKFPYSVLSTKFGSNPDFHLFPYGVGARDRKFVLYTTNKLGNDASEFLEPKRRRVNKEGKVNVEICNIKEFMQFTKDTNINHINLMALNCEGGEYEILEYLIEKDYIKNIYCFLISFHTPPDGVKISNCDERTKNIRDNLSKTHVCEWDYPMMWEKWVRK